MALNRDHGLNGDQIDDLNKTLLDMLRRAPVQLGGMLVLACPRNPGHLTAPRVVEQPFGNTSKKRPRPIALKRILDGDPFAALQEAKMYTGGVAGASGAAAAAAAIAQATKASGVIVRVEPRDFLRILEQQERPLVVHATGGFFNTNYQYLTSYKGLAFFTKSETPMNLPQDTELVRAKKIWIPA